MSNIRSFFTSRYPDGYLIELDYSQLEIYVLAFLSGDAQLKKDLLLGVDRHGVSAENLFGAGYTDKQRKIAKGLSFQLQYGAGAKSMAEAHNLTTLQTKAFIKQFYDRYPDVKVYQDRLLEQARLNRDTAAQERTAKGYPAGVFEHVSLTGRRYTHKEEDSPDWMNGDTSFSPTKLKNYQVQGFATGDIVPMMLGVLYREIRNNGWDDTVKIINTVHDSVLFDCKNLSTARIWAEQAKRIMESAPRRLKTVFDIDFDLPLPVEASIGKNWMEMEDLTL